jgi:hypothetical protein
MQLVERLGCGGEGEAWWGRGGDGRVAGAREDRARQGKARQGGVWGGGSVNYVRWVRI